MIKMITLIILTCWHSQVFILTCWHIDMLTHWHADTLTCWHVDMLTCWRWHVDTLTCWYIDMMMLTLTLFVYFQFIFTFIKWISIWKFLFAANKSKLISASQRKQGSGATESSLRVFSKSRAASCTLCEVNGSTHTSPPLLVLVWNLSRSCQSQVHHWNHEWNQQWNWRKWHGRSGFHHEPCLWMLRRTNRCKRIARVSFAVVLVGIWPFHQISDIVHSCCSKPTHDPVHLSHYKLSIVLPGINPHSWNCGKHSAPHVSVELFSWLPLPRIRMIASIGFRNLKIQKIANMDNTYTCI